jgi:hypothetical protein
MRVEGPPRSEPGAQQEGARSGKTAAARSRAPSAYTGCGAAARSPRLMRNTITAATRHSPPEIIDATV